MPGPPDHAGGPPDDSGDGPPDDAGPPDRVDLPDAAAVSDAVAGASPPYGIAYRRGDAEVTETFAAVRRRGSEAVELEYPDGRHVTVNGREELVALRRDG